MLQRIAMVLALVATGCPGEVDPDELDNLLAAAGSGDLGPTDAGETDLGATDMTVAPLCTAYQDIYAELVAPNCATAGCHDSVTMSQGLDLATPGIGARYAGVAGTDGPCILLDPDAPEESLFLTTLQPTNPCGVLRMPLVGTFDQTDIDCMTQWVDELLQNR
ncbi:MAG: hypothetical protein AAGD10_20315 [Myxococcota bacterium]